MRDEELEQLDKRKGILKETQPPWYQKIRSAQKSQVKGLLTWGRYTAENKDN